MALLHSINDAFSGWLLMLLVGLMAGNSSHDSPVASLPHPCQHRLKYLLLNLAEMFQLPVFLLVQVLWPVASTLLPTG